MNREANSASIGWLNCAAAAALAAGLTLGTTSVADDKPVPPLIQALTDEAASMSDVELMMVLGVVMTVLGKRRGLAFLKSAMDTGIRQAEESL